MATNMVFNLLLFSPFGHVGLAAATAISATVNMGLLMAGLIRGQVMTFERQWIGWIIRLVVANVAMIAALLFFMPELSQWRAWGSGERILSLLWTIGLGLVVYTVALVALGIRPRDLRVD